MSCTCRDVVRLLVDYLEANLSAEKQADLQRHLANCPRCVSQLKTYKCTMSLLKSVREEDLPPELRVTLKAFLDKNCSN